MSLIKRLFAERHGRDARDKEVGFHSPCSRFGILAAGNLIHEPLSETERAAADAAHQTREKEKDHGY